MYTRRNFRTKREFRDAVDRGETVTLFAPGLGRPATHGTEFVSGPHYPAAHSWYAEVKMADGIVIQVK